MNGGKWGYACGFCHKPFRTFNLKLRHLKECKAMLSDARGNYPLLSVPPRRPRNL